MSKSIEENVALPKPGTYQTNFRVEVWEGGKRKTPVVHYTTVFGGPTEDHDKLLDLIRDLHAKGDGKANALVEIFEKADAMLRFRKASEDLGEYAADLNDKLEAAKEHLEKYPEGYEGACGACPYLDDRKTREGACGNCAIGKVKFWLEDYKKIFDGLSLESLGINFVTEEKIIEDFGTELLLLEENFMSVVPFLRAGSDKKAQTFTEKFNALVILWKDLCTGVEV